MKRILALTLAVLMVVLAIPFTAAAATAANVTAKQVTTAPTIDGVKDASYPTAGLPINQALTGSADDVNGTAYFAYDNEYLYVFVDVNDATTADQIVDKKGIIGGTNGASCNSLMFNDAVAIQFNFEEKSGWRAIWGIGGVNENTDADGLYVMLRNGTNTHMGGHVFCQNSDGKENSYYFKSAVTEKEDNSGYSVEFRIPFGVDINKNAFDVATIFENGMSVILQITDAYTVNAEDSTKGDATNVILSNKRWGVSTALVDPSNGGMNVSNYTDGNADKVTFAPLALTALGDVTAPTNVYLDDTLTSSMFTVMGTYEGGGSAKLSASEYTVSPTTFTTTGVHDVTITCGSFTKTVTVNVQNNVYQTAKAYQVHQAPVADGVKDAAYANSTPLYTYGAGGEVVATTYFLWDTNNIYAFTEVNDSTDGKNPNTWNSVTFARQYDSFGLSLNYANTVVGSSSFGTDMSPLTALRVFGFRGDSNANTFNGAASGIGWTVNSVDSETGYTVEMVIPVTEVANGDNTYKFDLTNPTPIAVSARVADQAAGVTGTNATQYQSSGGWVDYNTGFKAYTNSATDVSGTYDKLVFVQDEITALEVSYTQGENVILVDTDIVLTGATATVTTEGGSTINIDPSLLTISPSKFTKPGTYNVTASYNGLSCTVTVKVTAEYNIAEIAYADTTVTLDGKKDAIYSFATPIAINQNGVTGTAYFVATETALYAFIDVNDSTKQTAFYNQGTYAEQDWPGQSQLCSNDSVTIGFNASGEQVGIDGTVTSNKASIAGAFRPVADTNIAVNARASGGGFAGVGSAVQEKADGTGYTMELEMTYNADGITKADLDGIAYMIEIVDTNREGGVITEEETVADIKANVKYAYSNVNYATNWHAQYNNNNSNGHLYVWQNKTLYTAQKNGFDMLTVKDVSDNAYTVTVDVNGATTTEKTAVGGAYTLPAAPDMGEGVSFLGWEYGENFLPAGTSVTLSSSTTIKAVGLKASTLQGASIRISEPTGLRFTTEIDEVSYDALSATVKSKLGFGMVLFPKDMLGENDLSKTSSVDKNGTTYSALVIENTKNMSDIKADGNYNVKCVWANIYSANYTRDVVARGYIDVSYTNSTTNTVYLGTITRNVKAVAQAALDSGKYTEGTNAYNVLNGFVGNN